ncbi:MAG: GGDEF domain-containing protein [Dehalococcoidia bacterium]|nr:GGDEF domain-containing protein [Dehalococcoidia bacterium]
MAVTQRLDGVEARPPGQREPDARSGSPHLPAAACWYLCAVYGAALLASAAVLVTDHSVSASDLPAFLALCGLAAISQILPVEAPNRQSYHATPAFLVAAALLVPPALYTPLVIIPLAGEWLRWRYPWYIQTFNISTYLINLLAAGMLFHVIAPGGDLQLSWASAGAAVAAGITFTALNHAMVAVVLWLARGIPPAQSGVISRESVEMDLALISVGIGLAVFWSVDPALLVLGIVPMFLFYRALSVPRLEQEAYHDAKTGVLVARRFMEILAHALREAAESRQPVAVAMADLDFFREVNNTHGHLVGDEVLKAVAGVMERTLRQHDVIGRFGGEEFVFLLRNTDALGAERAAQRVRAAVEAANFRVPGSEDALRVTVSIGVACFPEPCPDAEALLELADVAAYESKMQGRNRVTMSGTAAGEADVGNPAEAALSR